LCNLRDGTCDALELIPVLERGRERAASTSLTTTARRLSASDRHAVGFSSDAREAIRNIRENSKLASARRSPDR
jgi:hypothetical protein